MQKKSQAWFGAVAVQPSVIQTLHSSLWPWPHGIAQVGHRFSLPTHTYAPPRLSDDTTSGLATLKSSLGRRLAVSNTLRDQPVLSALGVSWFWVVFSCWQSSRCLWPGKQAEDQVLRWSCAPSQTGSARSTGCPTNSDATQLRMAEEDVMGDSHPLTAWHEIHNFLIMGLTICRFTTIYLLGFF